MTIYKFTLDYRVPVIDDLDEHVDALMENGCDDALVGIDDSGLMVLMFEREADSALKAIESAQEDVKKSIVLSNFLEAGPDNCSMTDLASHFGFSRQYMRKLWQQSIFDGFPDPVSRTNTPTWNLSKVLQWLVDNEKIESSEDMIKLLESSFAARSANVQSSIEDLVSSGAYGGGGQMRDGETYAGSDDKIAAYMLNFDYSHESAHAPTNRLN